MIVRFDASVSIRTTDPRILSDNLPSSVDTASLETKVRRALVAELSPPDGAVGKDEDAAGHLSQYARLLHTRHFEPFVGCSRICDHAPPTCLYRHAVSDLVTSRALADHWLQAEETDLADGTAREQTWQLCLDAAYKLIEFPEDQNQLDAGPIRRVGLCFAQQMLQSDALLHPRSVRTHFEAILVEADR